MIDTNKATEMMNDMASKGYDNLRKLGELQMSTWSQLMEKQITAFNTVVDSTIAQTKAFNDAKDYQEAMTTQVELGRKLAEDMTEQTREAVELVQEAGEKYRAFAEDAVKEAKDAAEEMTKAA